MWAGQVGILSEHHVLKVASLGLKRCSSWFFNPGYGILQPAYGFEDNVELQDL